MDKTSKTLFEQEFEVMHSITDQYSMDFHFHDLFEIYFNISGGEKYLIENKVYTNNPGDLFVINNYEVHKSTANKNQKYERIIIVFNPDYVHNYSTDDSNLLQCFLRRKKGFLNKIHLTKKQQEIFLSMANKIMNLDEDYFGYSILKKSYFIQLLVFINQWYLESTNDNYEEQAYEINATIQLIVHYIDNHLSSSISLDILANTFNISKYYMCQLFKKNTGITINRYITGRRISEAKKLLHQGSTVGETAEKTGFNDYTHFIRTFKKWVGISPKKYSKK